MLTLLRRIALIDRKDTTKPENDVSMNYKRSVEIHMKYPERTFSERICFSLLLLSVLTTTIFSSCKEEDEVILEGAQLSERTPSMSKEILQDNGIAVMESLTEISKSKAIDALISILDLGFRPDANSDDPAIPIALIQPVYKLSQEQSRGSIPTARELVNQSTKNTSSYSNEWEELVGFEYVYDPATNAFNTRSGATDKVIIKWPSNLETPNAIDVTLTISNFASHVVENQKVLDSNGVSAMEYLTSLNATMLIDGNEEMTIELDADYNNHDDLESILYSVGVGDFKYSNQENYGYNNILHKVRLDKLSERIFESEFYLTGDVRSLNDDVLDFELFDGGDELDEIESFTYSLKTKDIKMSYSLSDLQEMLSAIEAIEPDVDGDIKGVYDKLTEDIEAILNSYMDLNVVYLDDQTQMADLSLDLYVDNEDELTYFQPEVDLIMTFSDGSQVSADTFFSTGFNRIEDAGENMIDEILENLFD